MLGYLLFLLLPLLLSIALLFVKDQKPKRGRLVNILLIFNILLFLTPFFLALATTPSLKDIWNESSGGGTAFWLYYFVWPASALFLLLLLILKIVFNRFPGRG